MVGRRKSIERYPPSCPFVGIVSRSPPPSFVSAYTEKMSFPYLSLTLFFSLCGRYIAFFSVFSGGWVGRCKFKKRAMSRELALSWRADPTRRPALLVTFRLGTGKAQPSWQKLRMTGRVYVNSCGFLSAVLPRFRLIRERVTRELMEEGAGH